MHYTGPQPHSMRGATGHSETSETTAANKLGTDIGCKHHRSILVVMKICSCCESNPDLLKTRVHLCLDLIKRSSTSGLQHERTCLYFVALWILMTWLPSLRPTKKRKLKQTNKKEKKERPNYLCGSPMCVLAYSGANSVGSNYRWWLTPLRD